MMMTSKFKNKKSLIFIGQTPLWNKFSSGIFSLQFVPNKIIDTKIGYFTNEVQK